MNLKEPIFILGNPRSGTTLLRLMLNAHHEICIPPECGFIEWWYNTYKNWCIENNNENDIAGFIKDLQSSKKIETWDLDYQLLKNFIISEQPESYPSLCALVYYIFSVQQNKQAEYWGDKNNYYINKLDVLDKLFPNAYYLMIIRDGRDVAVSYRNIEKIKTTSIYKPRLPQNVRDIAHEWLTSNKTLIRFLNSSSLRKHLIIRYEDIISDTNNILKKICSWLMIDFDDNMLQYHIKNQLNGDEPIETLDWKRKTLQPPDVNNMGQYKKVLSLPEIEEFESVSYELLNYFGYC